MIFGKLSTRLMINDVVIYFYEIKKGRAAKYLGSCSKPPGGRHARECACEPLEHVLYLSLVRY